MTQYILYMVLSLSFLVSDIDTFKCFGLKEISFPHELGSRIGFTRGVWSWRGTHLLLSVDL